VNYAPTLINRAKIKGGNIGISQPVNPNQPQGLQLSQMAPVVCGMNAWEIPRRVPSQIFAFTVPLMLGSV